MLKFKKWWEGVTPHNGVHMGVFLLEEREGAEKRTKGEQRLVPGDKSGGGEKVGLGKEKDENWAGPTSEKGTQRTCTEVLLLAVAENTNCQDPKGRAIEVPEY